MDLKAQVLSAVEVIVKQQIAKESDNIVDLILKKLTTLIPGSIDDALAAANAPAVKAAVKAELLKLADLIDGVKA